jgi:hypothetical protein
MLVELYRESLNTFPFLIPMLSQDKTLNQLLTEEVSLVEDNSISLRVSKKEMDLTAIDYEILGGNETMIADSDNYLYKFQVEDDIDLVLINGQVVYDVVAIRRGSCGGTIHGALPHRGI